MTNKKSAIFKEYKGRKVGDKFQLVLAKGFRIIRIKYKIVVYTKEAGT